MCSMESTCSRMSGLTIKSSWFARLSATISIMQRRKRNGLYGLKGLRKFLTTISKQMVSSTWKLLQISRTSRTKRKDRLHLYTRTWHLRLMARKSTSLWTYKLLSTPSKVTWWKQWKTWAYFTKISTTSASSDLSLVNSIADSTNRRTYGRPRAPTALKTWLIAQFWMKRNWKKSWKKEKANVVRASCAESYKKRSSAVAGTSLTNFPSKKRSTSCTQRREVIEISGSKSSPLSQRWTDWVSKELNQIHSTTSETKRSKLKSYSRKRKCRKQLEIEPHRRRLSSMWLSKPIYGSNWTKILWWSRKVILRPMSLTIYGLARTMSGASPMLLVGSRKPWLPKQTKMISTWEL